MLTADKIQWSLGATIGRKYSKQFALNKQAQRVDYTKGKTLSRSDMHRWVQLHNATANLYFVKTGKIEDVEPAGWWY